VDLEAPRLSVVEAIPPVGPRLPVHDRQRRLLRSPLGHVVARPWLDATILRALRYAFFPLSRLWAAAEVAEGDRQAFWEHLGPAPRPGPSARLDRALRHVLDAKVVADAVDAAWVEAFFGASPPPIATRVALEAARHQKRDALNRTRAAFVPFLRRDSLRARLSVATPMEVAARTDLAAEPDHVFAAPERMPDVHQSHGVAAERSVDTWLRFRSPSRIDDTAWARVHTPIGVIDPPTVILGHGICIEFDHWLGLLDETQTLLDAGLRVIRPEAPWHGRRRAPGYYGGEKTIGTAPTGMLDHFIASLREWAVLADWARRTSAGPLGFAGTSLGALTAQLAGSVADVWPERLRPDALYLVTHSGSMSETTHTGAAARLFADPAEGLAHGWTAASVARLQRLADPRRPPVVPADRIVSVLGQRDVITPFDGGETLVWRWNLPPENVFLFDNGHFTIPMRLARDPRPTRRFAEVLRAAG
jgi:hypothetical protein